MIERIRADLSEEYATALKNYLATNSSANSLSSYPTTPFTPFDSTTGLGGSFFPERTGSLGNMFDLLGHKSPSSHTHHSHHSSSGASINPTPAPSAPSSPSRATPGLPTRKASMPGTGTSPEVSAMLTAEFSQKSYTLKPVFIEAIQELLDEVDMSYRAVGEQSWEHIHSG
jgi:translation initiation factor eIF-2B subunit beta